MPSVALVLFTFALAHADPTPAAPPTSHDVLERAVLACDVDALAPLLANKPDLERRNEIGVTVLHEAVSMCDVRVVELLLKSGAKPDVADDGKSQTPLMLAVVAKHIPKMRALLQAGADVNRVALKTTALAIALHENNAPAVVVLMRAGANPRHASIAPLLPRISEGLAGLLAACLTKDPACSLDAAWFEVPEAPSRSWWTKGAAACAPPARLEKRGDFVRCGCGGAPHGPYAELYPGTQKPLAVGSYDLARRHGVWTTWTRDGVAVARTKYFVDVILDEERLSPALIPPVYPGDFLTTAELIDAQQACSAPPPAK